jgi:hypothetical protein
VAKIIESAMANTYSHCGGPPAGRRDRNRNRRSGYWALLGALAVLSGCASPRLETRDQWLAESQRLYTDRDSEQVIRAAEAVIKNINPSTVTFAHNLDGFTATRPWFVYVIIASAVGTDSFEFKAVREAGGTRATLRIDRKSQDPNNGLRQEGTLSFIASYRHFFNNLEFALGKSSKWITCADAAKELGIENADTASTMCFPPATSQQYNPVTPRSEWTRPASKVLVVPGNSRETITRR